jgi:hypothetical protein
MKVVERNDIARGKGIQLSADEEAKEKYLGYHEKEGITAIIRKAKRVVLSDESYKSYIDAHYKGHPLLLPKIYNLTTDQTKSTFDAKIDTGHLYRNMNNTDLANINVNSTGNYGSNDGYLKNKFSFSTDPNMKLMADYYSFLGRINKNFNLNRNINKEEDSTAFQFNSFIQNSAGLKLNTNGTSPEISQRTKKINFYDVDTLRSSISKSQQIIKKNKKKHKDSLLENFISLEKLYDLEFTMSGLDLESEVYYKFSKDDIKNFLSTRTAELIEKGTENLTTFKNKKFNSSDPKEKIKFDLTINSLGIAIKEKSLFTDKSQPINSSSLNANKENSNEIKIDLPFTIIPFFYFTNMHNFKLVISQIIKFNDDFTSAKIDLDAVPKIMKKFEEKILNGGVYHQDSNFIIKNLNLELLSIDIVTTTNIYEMKITLPSISLTIENHFNYGTKKIIFNKLIDKQLMLFLINKNFLKWDFYLINYFSRFKLFRENVLHFSNNTYDNGKNKKIVNLDILINNTSSFITNSTESQKTVLSKTNCYEAIYLFVCESESIETQLRMYLNIKPHEVKITLPNGQAFNYGFNFKQMISLEKLKSFCNIEDFLKRCFVGKFNKRMKNYSRNELGYNNLKPEFNYKMIDSIDEDNIQLFLQKENLNNISGIEEKDDSNNSNSNEILSMV